MGGAGPVLDRGISIVKQRVWTKLLFSSNRPLETMSTLCVEPSLRRSFAL